MKEPFPYRSCAGFAMLMLVLSAFLSLSGCREDPVTGPDILVEVERRNVGELQAILEADSTFGPPHYPSTLRAVCTTNGGDIPIASAHLVGPFTDSAGFHLLDTGLAEAGDTLSITVSQPGQAQLTCTNEVGHSHISTLDFGGISPELDLNPLGELQIEVFEEARFEITDFVHFADSLYIDEPFVPAGLDIEFEVDQTTHRVWVTLLASTSMSSEAIRIRAINGFGTDRGNLRFTAEHAPSIELTVTSWDGRSPLRSRVSVLDALGNVMRDKVLEEGLDMLLVKDLPAPIASFEADVLSPGYFRRHMDFTSNGNNVQYVTIPVIPTAPCISLFNHEADPVASCVEMTRRLMFSPFYPGDPLEGFHGPLGGRSYFLMVHQETGATISAAWVVAVREAAQRWTNIGVHMEYPVATHGVGSNRERYGRVAYDGLGRLIATTPGAILYVADKSADAELRVNFITNGEEVTSALILLPVNDDPAEWTEELEWVRIQTEYTLARDEEFMTLDREWQNRFIKEWATLLHQHDRSNTAIAPGSSLEVVFPN